MSKLSERNRRHGDPRSLWVARIVEPPFSTDRGRWFHGGQIAAVACETRGEAVSAVRELARMHAIAVTRGARFIIEPSFMAWDSKPGREEAPLTAEQVNSER